MLQTLADSIGRYLRVWSAHDDDSIRLVKVCAPTGASMPEEVVDIWNPENHFTRFKFCKAFCNAVTLRCARLSPNPTHARCKVRPKSEAWAGVYSPAQCVLFTRCRLPVEPSLDVSQRLEVMATELKKSEAACAAAEGRYTDAVEARRRLEKMAHGVGGKEEDSVREQDDPQADLQASGRVDRGAEKSWKERGDLPFC
jgi:hypothetical protein